MAKPCMVTDLPNLKEQLAPEKSGFIFQFSKPESLLQPIRRLCNEPQLLKEMSSEASKFAAEHFDDKTNARRTTMIYHQLLGTASTDQHD